MNVNKVIGATVALGLVLVSLSNDAFAQSSTPKKPEVGGKPLVQIKPSAPIGCKLVGTVKGTKLWAGDCVAAPELRKTTPEDNAPVSSPETETAPKEQQ
jgi:hypothetical protein